MKKLSDDSIQRIAKLIALPYEEHIISVGTPGRIPGSYRTWPFLIKFLEEVDQKSQLNVFRWSGFDSINPKNGIALNGERILSKENATFKVLNLWNNGNPIALEIVFEKLLDKRHYFPGEEGEIIRVYNEINLILSDENLFFGGFPPKIIGISEITSKTKAKLEWDTIWYLASGIFMTNEELQRYISPLIMIGRFNDVVRNAAEIPFKKLKEKSPQLSVLHLDGIHLIDKALKCGKGTLCFGYESTEREDWALSRLSSMLKTLYQAFRNPSSHHFQIDNPWEAMLAIWNANWCIGEIEKLKERKMER